MGAGSGTSGKVAIVDAGHGIGLELAALLAGAGFEVVAWARGDGTEALGEATAVIFNMSALDEAELLAGGKLADAIEAEADFFLETLQAVSRSMIENGRGQIWVLAPDDSFSYYLPLPSAPVTHHTRVGAIRALAKEVARFGVCANAAILQPTAEMVAPAAWSAARAGVGSYAQKFRPAVLAPVAETLAFWLARETLPLNGSVLHFGSGVYDGNF
jgi:NAD(P)-dependent dehydrogenase (short-subunit alcohol dehydrogenase family)